MPLAPFSLASDPAGQVGGRTILTHSHRKLLHRYATSYPKLCSLEPEEITGIGPGYQGVRSASEGRQARNAHPSQGARRQPLSRAAGSGGPQGR